MGCGGRRQRQAHASVLDETLIAYGEVVWSRRRGAGVKSAREILPATEAKQPFSGEITK
jgi:hypothetical protein